METKKRKLPSPFVLKVLRRVKTNGVKCYLRAYQTKAIDPKSQLPQPFRIFYYQVDATDGSFFKTTDWEHANERYAQLLEFEKRQLIIK